MTNYSLTSQFPEAVPAIAEGVVLLHTGMLSVSPEMLNPTSPTPSSSNPEPLKDFISGPKAFSSLRLNAEA